MKLLCYNYSNWLHIGYMQCIKWGYWVKINDYMVTIYALHEVFVLRLHIEYIVLQLAAGAACQVY